MLSPGWFDLLVVFELEKLTDALAIDLVQHGQTGLRKPVEH